MQKMLELILIYWQNHFIWILKTALFTFILCNHRAIKCIFTMFGQRCTILRSLCLDVETNMSTTHSRRKKTETLMNYCNRGQQLELGLLLSCQENLFLVASCVSQTDQPRNKLYTTKLKLTKYRTWALSLYLPQISDKRIITHSIIGCQ